MLLSTLSNALGGSNTLQLYVTNTHGGARCYWLDVVLSCAQVGNVSHNRAAQKKCKGREETESYSAGSARKAEHNTDYEKRLRVSILPTSAALDAVARVHFKM